MIRARERHSLLDIPKSNIYRNSYWLDPMGGAAGDKDIMNDT